MERVVTTGGAITRAKLQSNRHHQQTNIQLFTADVIHTAGRVYKKVSKTMHTPGREQILTLTLTLILTLTLAVYHASFVYTYGRPCV